MFIMEVKVIRLDREKLWWKEVRTEFGWLSFFSIFLWSLWLLCTSWLLPLQGAVSTASHGVWILALPVISPIPFYSAKCPACCSPFCLPCTSSLNFHYPNASCMKVHVFVPFLVTLLTFTMLPHCVWICHNFVTKCVHTVVDNTTLVCIYLDSRQANYILKNKLLM